MQEQNQEFEQEIDLREYIETILKHKKLILAIVFVSVIATAVMIFMTPRVYKATATIMITPSAMKSAISPSKGVLDAGMNETASPLSITMATHMTLLKTNIVLERTIKKLNLKEPSGKDVTVEALSKRLNLLDIKKPLVGNVFQLEATDGKPEEAQAIANAWAGQYVDYSQELILGEVSGVGDFVMNQFEISKKDLLQAEEKVNNFRKGYKQDLASEDLNMKKEALNGYKKEFAGIELALKTKADSLAELKEQIKAQEKFIVVSKAITDDALWQVSSQKDGTRGIDQKGLRSEEVNPIYQALEGRIVSTEVKLNSLKPRVEYLNKLIASLTKETTEQENEIIQKNFDLNQLVRQAEILKKSYDLFSSKVNDARIIKAAQLGEVKIVSPAVALSRPVSRGGLQKIILAGILSLMVGTFIAFFMEFWQKSKPAS